PSLPGLGPAPPRGEPGPPCLRCGSDTIVSPGQGPHHARADCPRCGAWRWPPRRPPTRRGKGGAL
ncbi:MAG TPA: hypothetical protein VFF52_00265, partial [Isosphaeraceae bacterium]|nr:hypothetical protein [Isosphaeraceae bacterium]